jgi:hypothetical protein
MTSILPRNRLALATIVLLVLGAVATLGLTVYLARAMVVNLPEASVGGIVLDFLSMTLAGLAPYALMAVAYRRLAGATLPDTVLLIGAVGIVVFAAWAYFAMFSGPPGHGSYSFYLVPVFQCVAVAVIGVIAWAAREIEGGH